MTRALSEEFMGLNLFSDIHNTTRELLELKAFKLSLKKGQQLFGEREEVENIYIVLRGKVTLYRNSEHGQKRVIFILNPGEIINEVIFDRRTASVNCEAFEDSEVLYFSRNELLEIMSRDFDFTKKIIESMAKKIRRTYRQIKNTVPIKMDKRLAAKLWKLSKDYGVETESGTLIGINLTITYLADMLGSSRETISRCMGKFEKEGLIISEGKKIIIPDRDKLSIYFRGV